MTTGSSTLPTRNLNWKKMSPTGDPAGQTAKVKGETGYEAKGREGRDPGGRIRRQRRGPGGAGKKIKDVLRHRRFRKRRAHHRPGRSTGQTAAMAPEERLYFG